jgi:hypothetical protein
MGQEGVRERKRYRQAGKKGGTRATGETLGENGLRPSETAGKAVPSSGIKPQTYIIFLVVSI